MSLFFLLAVLFISIFPILLFFFFFFFLFYFILLYPSFLPSASSEIDCKYPILLTFFFSFCTILGKAGVMQGCHKYGTAFGGSTVESCSAELISNGFRYTNQNPYYYYYSSHYGGGILSFYSGRLTNRFFLLLATLAKIYLPRVSRVSNSMRTFSWVRSSTKS